MIILRRLCWEDGKTTITSGEGYVSNQEYNPCVNQESVYWYGNMSVFDQGPESGVQETDTGESAEALRMIKGMYAHGAGNRRSRAGGKVK